MAPANSSNGKSPTTQILVTQYGIFDACNFSMLEIEGFPPLLTGLGGLERFRQDEGRVQE